MNAQHIQPAPYINTNREKRFLCQLLAGRTAIHDLRAIAGAENHWQLCADMRTKGWLITTTSQPFIDRDGLKVRVGYYELHEGQFDSAVTIIKAWKGKQNTKKELEIKGDDK